MRETDAEWGAKYDQWKLASEDAPLRWPAPRDADDFAEYQADMMKEDDDDGDDPGVPDDV